MVEGRVYTTVRGQSHEVEFLASLFGITESRFDFCVFENATVFASTVDLYEVLIHHATCADVQVTYFGVTHLSIRQTHVFATGLELAVRVLLQQCVPVWGWSARDSIGL